MSKITDAIFGRLSDILKASAEELKDFSSVERTSEYTPISEKQQVIRKIVLKADDNSTKSVQKALKDHTSEVVTAEMLDDINTLFTDIIVGKKTKLKPKSVKKDSLKATPLRSNLSGRFLSLFSLQDLLNKRLADQIQRNMGKGGAKAILNYRTGRFAESATVTRLTRTKEGAISAFYTYMHYPYQTFEPGFKQGLPISRDPRLLIGKSIRQLAVELASIRLKAIPT